LEIRPTFITFDHGRLSSGQLTLSVDLLIRGISIPGTGIRLSAGSSYQSKKALEMWSTSQNSEVGTSTGVIRYRIGSLSSFDLV